MWLKSVLNAQLQLQSHRIWLTSFQRCIACPNRWPQPAINRTIDPFPQRAYGIQQQARRYSSQRHKQRRSGLTREKKQAPLRVSDDTFAILRALRQAIADEDIRAVIQLYAALDVKDVLRPTDLRVIAQCLQQSLRRAKELHDPQTRRTQMDEMLAFAQILVNDLMQETVAPHRHAHIHLLGFFKECGARDAGIRFWKWLERQTDLYVSPNVYGSAIELLAANGSSLEELEDLYQQALERFPGPFLSYHLSPEGIVPDREMATTLNGVPMGLLQGIITARLMRNDTRNAYLALDTALRLYPDQIPRRFFHLFMVERPLAEACTVFAMACRAGVVVSKPYFSSLLTALRLSSDLTSLRQHALVVRAMLSMSYAYASAGGAFKQNQLNELVIGMTQFFRLKGLESLDSKVKTKTLEQGMELIRTTLAAFARCGVRPGLPALNSIIGNLGRHGRSSQIIAIALTDIRSLGLQPDVRTRRAILTAAGVLKDDKLVQKAWGELLQTAADDSYTLRPRDGFALVRSAVASGQPEFARSQLQGLKDVLAEGEINDLLSSLQTHEEGAKEIDQSADIFDVDALSETIDLIRSDLSVLEEALRDGPTVRDLRESPLVMNVLPVESALPEAEMRQLYNELTTDKRTTEDPDAIDETTSIPQNTESQTPASSGEASTSPTLSSTNLTFATLRYENWKDINCLIEQGEISDQAYSDTVDEAISAGTMPPRRELRLRVSEATMSTVGLSDLVRDGPNASIDADGESMSAAEIEAGRQKILRLRGRVQ